MKIRVVGAEMLRADRRTDRLTAMTQLTVSISNFAKVPKHKELWNCCRQYLNHCLELSAYLCLTNGSFDVTL